MRWVKEPRWKSSEHRVASVGSRITDRTRGQDHPRVESISNWYTRRRRASERERDKRTKVGLKWGGKGKERTYRCTRAAYVPVGRASIHDNGHDASLCRTYRGAGAFESRSYRGRDLRLARELHGGSDGGTNHAIGCWCRDRTSTPWTAEFFSMRKFFIIRSFVCSRKIRERKSLCCRRTTILFMYLTIK